MHARDLLWTAYEAVQRRRHDVQKNGRTAVATYRPRFDQEAVLRKAVILDDWLVGHLPNNARAHSWPVLLLAFMADESTDDEYLVTWSDVQVFDDVARQESLTGDVMKLEDFWIEGNETNGKIVTVRVFHPRSLVSFDYVRFAISGSQTDGGRPAFDYVFIGYRIKEPKICWQPFAHDAD